jgi:hypothetical protein
MDHDLLLSKPAPRRDRMNQEGNFSVGVINISPDQQAALDAINIRELDQLIGIHPPKGAERIDQSGWSIPFEMIASSAALRVSPW